MRCRKKFPNIIIRSAKRWPPDDTGRNGAAAHETCVAVVRFEKRKMCELDSGGMFCIQFAVAAEMKSTEEPA